MVHNHAFTGRAARRHVLRLMSILPVCGALVGCVSNSYEIEITPDGQSLDRRIVCWRQESDGQQQGAIAQDELDRIALAYGVQAPLSAAQKFEFRSRFEHNTPQDVGGSGSLTVWSTSLGSTSMYVERFRGSDDLATTQNARREAADELTDALIAWFRAELGEDDAFARVHTLFDETLRQDLRNIGAYAWTATAVKDATATDSCDFEMLVRTAQYFVERGYFRVDDVPELLRAVEESNSARLAVFLRRVLLTKLGLPKQETGWDFLSDPDRIQESLNEDLQHFPGYVRFCEQHGAGERPPPVEYVQELCLRVADVDLFADTDRLRVTVRCPVPPFRTNGAWSDDNQAVEWMTSIPGFGAEQRSGLPPLLFAFWSIPNEDFQSAHFGRVILRDQPLAEYCVWYKGLTTDEASEWDGLLAGLDRDKSLPEQLERFRFSDDPPRTEENESPPSHADTARELIRTGLSEP